MNRETQIDKYLTAFRLNLGPLTIAEREEVVREIGSHIRDSAQESNANVESVLARLGTPEALAEQYRDGLLITQASRSLSPVVLLRATLRLATHGASGALVFFVGTLGYAFGAGTVITALLKPLLPANTGLWVRDGHFASAGMLFPYPPYPAYDVLGMWYIPLALIVGSLTLLATTWIIRRSLRLSQRWRSRL